MKSILIVENNPHFRRALKETIDMHLPGALVTEASNGEEAWRKVNEEAPGMVFVEVRLPGMSGLRLTREIKRYLPRTVVAMLASYDFPEYRNAAFGCGADHYLPIDTLTAADIAALARSTLSESITPFRCASMDI
jgi:DNA-binding NarL/FixJ family response regulator